MSNSYEILFHPREKFHSKQKLLEIQGRPQFYSISTKNKIEKTQKKISNFQKYEQIFILGAEKKNF